MEVYGSVLFDKFCFLERFYIGSCNVEVLEVLTLGGLNLLMIQRLRVSGTLTTQRSVYRV